MKKNERKKTKYNKQRKKKTLNIHEFKQNSR